MDARIDYDNPDWHEIVLALRRHMTLKRMREVVGSTSVKAMSQDLGFEPGYRTGRRILKLYEKYYGGEDES